MRHYLKILFCIACLCSPFTSYGQEGTTVCQIPADYVINPPSEPTDIIIGLYVINIEGVNSVAQNFSADFVTVLQWQDPRLVHTVEKCQFTLLQVWHPRLELFNMQSIKKDLPEVVEVTKDGRVRYIQRFHGNLAALFDLQKFPFDQQVLPITFVSFGYSMADIHFIFDDERVGHAERFR